MMLSDFKIFYKVIVIEIVSYWHKNRYTDQWNTVEISEIKPRVYGQLIHDRGTRNTQQGRDNLFSKWCGDNWTAT